MLNKNSLLYLLYLLNAYYGATVVKESACQCRTCGYDHWIGKIPWKGNDNPLQYSCLGNPMEGGAWWATIHGVAKSQIWRRDWEQHNKPPKKTTMFIVTFQSILCESLLGNKDIMFKKQRDKAKWTATKQPAFQFHGTFLYWVLWL